jgi:hypothetical protein
MARRFTTAVVLLAGVFAGPVAAQPKEGQPRGEVARRLAEEVELLEAHLDTRKAHIRAAEVAVAAAERSFTMLAQAGRAVDAITLEKAKTALETAKAQADIRKAEMKEVEVKLKHARRRADDAAKEAAKQPATDVRRLEASLAVRQLELARAQAVRDQQMAEHDRAKKLLDAKVIAQEEFDAARVRLAQAELEVRAAAAEAKKAEISLWAFKKMSEIAEPKK